MTKTTTLPLTATYRWDRFTRRYYLSTCLPHSCGLAAGELYMGTTREECDAALVELNAKRAALGLTTFTLSYN